MNFPVPADHRSKLKESEKSDKYVDFARELKTLWNMKVTIIPIVIGVFGTVTLGLVQGLEELEITERVETVQTWAFFKSARIVRWVLGSQRKEKRKPTHPEFELRSPIIFPTTITVTLSSIFICISMCACMRAYVCVFESACVYPYVCVCKYACIYACVCVYVRGCILLYVFVCACVYDCLCVCVCVCIYIFSGMCVCMCVCFLAR